MVEIDLLSVLCEQDDQNCGYWMIHVSLSSGISIFEGQTCEVAARKKDICCDTVRSVPVNKKCWWVVSSANVLLTCVIVFKNRVMELLQKES